MEFIEFFVGYILFSGWILLHVGPLLLVYYELRSVDIDQKMKDKWLLALFFTGLFGFIAYLLSRRKIHSSRKPIGFFYFVFVVLFVFALFANEIWL